MNTKENGAKKTYTQREKEKIQQQGETERRHRRCRRQTG